MPTFQIQAPSGRTYTIEADDQAAAINGVHAEEQRHPDLGAAVGAQGGVGGPGASTAEDVIRGGVGGLIQGAVSTLNPQNDAGNMGVRLGAAAVRAGARATGNRRIAAAGDRAANLLERGADNQFSTSGRLIAGSPLAAPGSYQPQTEVGRFAQTVGQNAPGALVPGGLIARGAAVLLPAVGSEVGGLIAQSAGAPEPVVTAARIGGGLIGGLSSGLRPRNVAGLLARRAVVPAETSATGLIPQRDVLGDYTTANVDPMLATVGPQGAQMTAQRLAGAPLAGVPLRQGARRLATQVEASAENTAAGYGAARKPFQVGETLQQGAAEATAARGSQATDQADVQARVAPLTTSPVPSTAVSTRLNADRDAAQQGVTAAYQAARDADAAQLVIPRTEHGPLVENLQSAVRDYDPVRAGATQRAIQGLEGRTDVTAEDLFRTRSVLSKISSDFSNPTDASAAATARRALDGEIDRLEPGMSGDPGAIQAWRNANGLRRQFGQQFEDDGIVSSLTERTTRNGQAVTTVAPEDALNTILGRGNIQNRPNLTRDLTALRDRLGSDSPEWGNVRAEAARRLVGEAQAATGAGSSAISGQRLATAWQRVRSQNPEVAGLLFGGHEGPITDAISQAMASDRYWSGRQNEIVDQFVGGTEQGAYERLRAMAQTRGARSSAPQIQQLRSAVGEDRWSDVAAGMTHNLGRTPQGTFSVAQFATDWNNMTPEARVALFGGSGHEGRLSTLDALARVAGDQQAASKFYNHSQSGNALAGHLSAGAYAAAGTALLTQANPAPLSGLAALDGIQLGASSLLSSPAVARVVLRAAQARTVTQVHEAARQLAVQAARTPALAPQINAVRTRLLNGVAAAVPGAAAQLMPAMAEAN